MLKAKEIKFFIWTFLIMWKNCLRKLLKLILKCMTSQTGQEMIPIYILPNISKSKGNQTMKLGQLIAYNMRNISDPLKIKHITGSKV